jgi:hypothetical protein
MELNLWTNLPIFPDETGGLWREPLHAFLPEDPATSPPKGRSMTRGNDSVFLPLAPTE